MPRQAPEQGSPPKILMITAENDALLNCKVGGIGDVVRDAAMALARHEGCEVDVLVPSYGYLHLAPPSGGDFQSPRPGEEIMQVRYPFGGVWEFATLYQVQPRDKLATPGVRHFVLHHPGFEHVDSTGKQRIFCDDPPERPFATDATKYARFCMGAAEAIKNGCFGTIHDRMRLHVHDWHAAFLLILARFDPAYRALADLQSVLTIHNLDLQGIRPFGGDPSSLSAWYPHLQYDKNTLVDPEYDQCVNPMAAAIRLAHVIHTVSPSYAEEIIAPSLPNRKSTRRTYHGGEGLEKDLLQAHRENRLFGILNGCEYAESRTLPTRTKTSFRDLLRAVEPEILRWGRKSLTAAHLLALRRVDAMLQDNAQRPGVILTSCTRVVYQKVSLMFVSGGDGMGALERILRDLPESGVYILLGTGDAQYEESLFDLALKYPQFLFLPGYSEKIANLLYANGDIFLMPSIYEPCGISQMAAMRDGQVCVVHEIGGLKDTVSAREGFGFAGTSPEAKADDFVKAVAAAIDKKLNEPEDFQCKVKNSFRKRFLWSDSVRKYMTCLYKLP